MTSSSRPKATLHEDLFRYSNITIVTSTTALRCATCSGPALCASQSHRSPVNLPRDGNTPLRSRIGRAVDRLRSAPLELLEGARLGATISNHVALRVSWR